MSSPARSSVSATSIGGHGSNAGGGTGDNDNNANSSHSPFPSDFKSAQDRKEEAMIVLKSDVMAALQKEVKSLDEDSWKFAGPRSQIHLISRAVVESEKFSEVLHLFSLSKVTLGYEIRFRSYSRQSTRHGKGTRKALRSTDTGALFSILGLIVLFLLHVLYFVV